VVRLQGFDPLLRAFALGFGIDTVWSSAIDNDLQFLDVLINSPGIAFQTADKIMDRTVVRGSVGNGRPP
jgi:hypothetical protein